MKKFKTKEEVKAFIIEHADVEFLADTILNFIEDQALNKGEGEFYFEELLQAADMFGDEADLESAIKAVCINEK